MKCCQRVCLRDPGYCLFGAWGIDSPALVMDWCNGWPRVEWRGGGFGTYPRDVHRSNPEPIWRRLPDEQLVACLSLKLENTSSPRLTIGSGVPTASSGFNSIRGGNESNCPEWERETQCERLTGSSRYSHEMTTVAVMATTTTTTTTTIEAAAALLVKGTTKRGVLTTKLIRPSSSTILIFCHDYYGLVLPSLSDLPLISPLSSFLPWPLFRDCHNSSLYVNCILAIFSLVVIILVFVFNILVFSQFFYL